MARDWIGSALEYHVGQITFQNRNKNKKSGCSCIVLNSSFVITSSYQCHNIDQEDGWKCHVTFQGKRDIKEHDYHEKSHICREVIFVKWWKNENAEKYMEMLIDKTSQTFGWSGAAQSVDLRVGLFKFSDAPLEFITHDYLGPYIKPILQHLSDVEEDYGDLINPPTTYGLVEKLLKIETIWLGSKYCQQGMGMKSISSPFGMISPNCFFNCVSSGMVSAVFGYNHPTLLIVDIQQLLPGSEGGACYNILGQLAAMVMPPIRSLQHDMKLLVAVPIVPMIAINLAEDEEMVLSLLTNSVCLKEVALAKRSQKYEADCITLKRVKPSVVRLSVHIDGMNHWSSGIIVNDPKNFTTYIVTNAHFVNLISEKDYDTWLFEARYFEWKGNRWDQRINFAKAIFSVSEGAVDLALLRVSNYIPHGLILKPKVRLQRGMTCFVLGFAFLYQSQDLIITKGIVSNILRLKRHPVMLQTSAFVFPGHSGGLICDSHGNWIGMVKSNTRFQTHSKSTSNTTYYPSLGYGVPCWMLRHLSTFFSYVGRGEEKQGICYLNECYNQRNIPLQRIYTFHNDIDYHHQEPLSSPPSSLTNLSALPHQQLHKL